MVHITSKIVLFFNNFTDPLNSNFVQFQEAIRILFIEIIPWRDRSISDGFNQGVSPYKSLKVEAFKDLIHHV